MNNYGYGGQNVPSVNYQQNYPQRFQTPRPQFRISANSRPVFSEQEFQAIPADLDGALLLCPDLNAKMIYAKQLDLETGRVDSMQFQMVPPPPVPEFVTAQTFQSAIEELKSMIAGIAGSEPKRATVKRKGVAQDVVSVDDGE